MDSVKQDREDSFVLNVHVTHFSEQKSSGVSFLCAYYSLTFAHLAKKKGT